MQLICGDCVDAMKGIGEESIDLVVTSPPYDNLRTYNGNISQWNFDKFKSVANELLRIVKRGGGNCLDSKRCYQTFLRNRNVI